MYVTSILLNGWNSNRVVLSVDILLYQAVIGVNIAGLFLSSKPFIMSPNLQEGSRNILCIK